MLPIGSPKSNHSARSLHHAGKSSASRSLFVEESTPTSPAKLNLLKKNQSLHQLGQLHLPKIMAGQQTEHIESDIHYQHQRSRVKTNYMSLFMDEKTAQAYEDSFLHLGKRNPVRPTPKQLQQIEALFSVMETLKNRKEKIYFQVCFCLRYPYTFKAKGMPPVGHNYLNFSGFCNYFLKILWHHRGCPNHKKEPFCAHVLKFTRTLKGLSQITPIQSEKTLK